MIPFDQIDNRWTLFLDRDGVINHEKHEDYIHNWQQFKFYDRVTEAMKIFAEIFPRIIIVTNQRGIGRGLTKEEDVLDIHTNMTNGVMEAGGRIDAIYYCGDADSNSPHRKPNPGMGLRAIQEFPAIDPARTIMVGNTLSDMEFGRNLGMFTVFLPTTRPEVDVNDSRIDAVFTDLYQFASFLKQTLS